MRNGKHVAKRTGSKVAAVAIALVLVCCMAVGGTLAWLMDETDEVVNTFTSAELFADPTTDFTLWEHEVADEDKDGQYTLTDVETDEGIEYTILPGVNIPKDPTVDVVNLKSNAYLFIKVVSTLETGLSYALDDCWEAVDGYSGIYVYTVDDSAVIDVQGATKTFEANILADKQIVVATDYVANTPGSLSFTAYMVQATGNGANAAEAWANTYDK